jgi:hypothetical protein
LTPEPSEALEDVGHETGLGALPLFLERGPDEEQGDERDRVGNRVDDEGKCAAQTEEDAAEGLSREVGAWTRA